MTRVLLVLIAIGLRTGPPAHAGTPAARPRIANGIVTGEQPSTGALIVFAPDGSVDSCSGTLIGCNTFLTAAHCVCPIDARTAAACMSAGVADPANLLIFLQHAGYFTATDVAINPDFDFSNAGDLAVITLSAQVTCITPAVINTVMKPLPGTTGTLVGFGNMGTQRSTGIKRTGKVATSACSPNFPDDPFVCWAFTAPLGPAGKDSNTCYGDSGGPLFIDFGSGDVLAGVTSGGESACLPPDFSFDTDVYTYRDFLQTQAGSDLDTPSCGDRPPVGGDRTHVFVSQGVVNVAQPEQRSTFVIEPGTALVRVAMNGESGTFGGNDFDVFVRFNAPPTVSLSDCNDQNSNPLGFCEITDPSPGTWHVLVERVTGGGSYQLVVTTFPGAPTCTGDCDADGHVDATELASRFIPLIFGSDIAATCPGQVGLPTPVRANNLVAGVRSAGDGCP